VSNERTRAQVNNAFAQFSQPDATVRRTQSAGSLATGAGWGKVRSSGRKRADVGKHAQPLNLWWRNTITGEAYRRVLCPAPRGLTPPRLCRKLVPC